MAILAAKNSNLSLDKIFEVIPKIKSVEGRFERIGKIKNNSKVILDYAHTPEALKTCILNLREQFKEKEFVYYLGVAEIEIKIKEFQMGKIVSDYSDKIYLTDDNPRFENPEKIRKDVKKGIKKQKLLKYLIGL